MDVPSTSPMSYRFDLTQSNIFSSPPPLIDKLQSTGAFYPHCDQQATEEKLTQSESLFLLRMDPANEYEFILSYKSEEKVQHVRFCYLQEKDTIVNIADEAKSYTSIEKLIEEYTRTPFINCHIIGLDCEDMDREYESIPNISKAKVDELYYRFYHRGGNRYSNIFPFPSNAIQLPSNKYINASRVCLQNGAVYISAQGPMAQNKDNTLNEFWEMVWHEDVPVIVMVADLVENGKEKCAKYWPNKNSDCSYGDITVSTIEEKARYAGSNHPLEEGLTHRIFQLTRGEDKKIVHQYKFEKWPDFGVGNIQLVSRMINDVNSTRTKMDATDKPLLVHCSAGIGRTGTFIAEHHISGQIEQSFAKEISPTVSVRDTVIALRDEKTGRMNMVQAVEQYKHIYELLRHRFERNL